jgi:hypothetical protein
MQAARRWSLCLCALVAVSAAARDAGAQTSSTATGAQPEAVRVKEAISLSPALVLRAPTAAASKPLPAPQLSNRVEPKTPVTPPAGTVLYRPLTVAQEREVHSVLAKQLKWPEQGGDKNVAMFQGAVQTAQPGQPELTIKAIAAVDAPLRFVPERKLFEGRIQVGFVEIGATQSARPLNGRFAFQVQGPVTPDPDIVETNKTAPPFEVIRVATATPESDVKVTVRSSVNPEGVQLVLQVQRPRLNVSISPARIQGFGLEVADVVVQSNSPPETRGATVLLASDTGRIEPLSFTLDDSGIARATIRSVSTGRATVTASGSPFEPGAGQSVEFVFPWSFLVSALVGGLAGGIVRKGARWRAALSQSATELLVAVLTGAIVFGLFALGVNLFAVSLPQHGGEVLVFVVAALGAFIGTKLLPGAAGSKA